MKRQLLSVLAVLFVFLFLGEAQAFQCNIDPIYGRGDDDFSDDGGGGAGGGACQLQSSVITISQEFDPHAPVFPTAVLINVTYALKHTPTVYETKVFSFPNFSYDEVNNNTQVATKIIETIYHCDNFSGDSDNNYEFYEMEIIADYGGACSNTTTNLIVEDGARVNTEGATTPSNVLTAFVGFPNPFQNNLTINYNLTGHINNVILQVANSQGATIAQLNNAPKASQNSIPLNTTNWQLGTYYINVIVEHTKGPESESGHIETHSIIVVKNTTSTWVSQF